MMDLSDGLAKDVHSLEPPGGTASIYAAALPGREGVTLRAALTEGEDYELLLTVASATNLWRFESAFARAFPRVALTRIGQLTPKGKPAPGALVLEGLRGYEHLH
jgi:thiamine-monophosphate kinase